MSILISKVTNESVKTLLDSIMNFFEKKKILKNINTDKHELSNTMTLVFNIKH